MNVMPLEEARLTGLLAQGFYSGSIQHTTNLPLYCTETMKGKFLYPCWFSSPWIFPGVSLDFSCQIIVLWKRRKPNLIFLLWKLIPCCFIVFCFIKVKVSHSWNFHSSNQRKDSKHSCVWPGTREVHTAGICFFQVMDFPIPENFQKGRFQFWSMCIPYIQIQNSW